MTIGLLSEIILQVFRSLRYRNFRIYLGGQFFSLIGTWVQQLAMSWMVYRMTHSAFWLGIVTFTAQIPTFLFSPFTGVWVDRANRHQVLKWTQALSAVQALALALFTLKGWITLPWILILGAVLGIINSVDMPTRQTFLIQLIEDRKDLANAIALNSSVINGSRLIGPAAGGLMISLFGEGICFLLNAMSYVAVLIALNLMVVKKGSRSHQRDGIQGFWLRFHEGVRFAFGFAPIGTVLLLLCWLSLVGVSFLTLLPMIVDHFFQGGAQILGLLSGAFGVGAFLATFYLAYRKTVLYLGHLVGICAIGAALGVLALAITPFIPSKQNLDLGFVVAVLILAGFTMLLQMAGANILIQTLVHDDKRGRIMGLFSLALMGIAPIGSLLVGVLADLWGVLGALISCGMTYLCVGIWYWNRLRKLDLQIHPIYQEMGILPNSVSHSGESPVPTRGIF